MSRSFARPRLATRRTIAAFALGAGALLAACSPATSTTAPAASAPAQSAPAAPPAASAPAAVQALPAEVSTADALALRDAGAFVLDVRQPEEWAAGHIPDATLIPLGELASRIAEVPGDRQVVVVCRSGNRSAQGRDVLLGAGYPAVTSMAGGMNDWTTAGYPTESGS